MNKGDFTVINGEGHTAPEQERSYLTVISGSEEQLVFDSNSSSTSPRETLASPEDLIEDPQEYVRRMLEGRSHPGHPSERPHEEPDKNKWLPFHLPWNRK